MKLIALDGNVYDAIRVSPDCVDAHGDCYDCGQPAGEDHKPGCDIERCPRCKGQFISCDCDTSEKPLWNLQEMREVVRNLGRVLDNEDHTAKIQKAIDDAYEQGGGIVTI